MYNTPNQTGQNEDRSADTSTEENKAGKSSQTGNRDDDMNKDSNRSGR